MTVFYFGLLLLSLINVLVTASSKTVYCTVALKIAPQAGIPLKCISMCFLNGAK